MPPLLNIGLLGAGCVGSGVYDLIRYRLNSSSRYVITKILVRSLSKRRPFTVDTEQCTVTDRVEDILDDESINVIVEVVGGSEGLAKDAVYNALKRGKHVVTANKALIAENLSEIETLLSSLSTSPTPCFRYEASVCGGIPIIATLQTSYPADTITSLTGIFNGTTNFILSKMESGGSYASILKEAQDMGYAEADPTADVEGHDARAKALILSRLAFGVGMTINDIPTVGITSVSSIDFEYAKLMGMTIRLLGVARRNRNLEEFDGPLSVSVSPHLVPVGSVFGQTYGGNNAVVIRSKNLGTSTYTGPGAGRFETANSVVADIVRIGQVVEAGGIDMGTQSKAEYAFPNRMTQDDIGTKVDKDYQGTFYVRITISDCVGIVRSVGEIAEKHNVSINQILQNKITDRSDCSFVVTTEEAAWTEVKGMTNDIQKQEFCKEVFVLPIFEQ